MNYRNKIIRKETIIMLNKISIKLSVCLMSLLLFTCTGYSQTFDTSSFFTVSLGNTAGARTYAELDTAFKMLTELGCNYTKWNFNWGQIEPQPGNYDWIKTDSIAILAQRYNISIIAFVPQINTPFWARKPGSSGGVPSNPGVFARFVHQILNRYRGSMAVKFVEILNEISNGTNNGVTPPFTNPHWDTSAAYGAVVTSAVFDTVHAFFSDVKVGSASFTQPHGLSTGGMLAEDTVKDTWMHAYFSANPRFDYLAIHNYPHYGPTQIGNYRYATQYSLTNLYRGLLDNYGYGNTPILITEGAIGIGAGVNHQLYAAFLAQDCVVMYSKANGTSLNRMVEADLANAVGGTTGFNIANVLTGERYASFYAFKTTKRILEKYPEYVGRTNIQLDSLSNWVLKFKDAGNNNLFVAFAPIQIYYPNPNLPNPREFRYREPQTVLLDIGSNRQALISELNGNAYTTYSDSNGYIALNVYKEALFIEVSASPTLVDDKSLDNIPKSFMLFQNYPNPFNPATTIRFFLPQREHVTLKVYDVLGREVTMLVNRELNAGKHSVVYSAACFGGLPSGIYFYSVSAGAFVETKKMLITK